MTDDQSPHELLSAALNSPCGVAVATSDPQRLKQRLYAEIRKDPDFAIISLNTSRTDPANELWLVRKDATNGP